MKKLKKAAALLLAAALMLSLSACGSFETKMAKATAKMSELESCHMDMDMQLNMAMSVMGQDLDLDVSGICSIDEQQEPLRMKMDMDVSTMGFSQRLLFYMEKSGDDFTTYISPDGGDSWIKETVEAEDMPEQTDKGNSLMLFADCAASFKKAGTETVLGSDATRYDGELTGEDIEKALELSGAEETLSESLEMDDISQLGSMPCSIWIDNRSGMIVRCDMDATLLMQSLMTAVMDKALDTPETQGVDVEMEINTVTVSMVLSQFDRVDEIEIPAEARAAA